MCIKIPSIFQFFFLSIFNVVIQKAIVVLMIDKWKEAVDNNNKVFGGLLTGLSKAFD